MNTENSNIRNLIKKSGFKAILIATCISIAALICLFFIILVDDTLDYNLYFLALSLIILIIFHTYKYHYTIKFRLVSTLSYRSIDYTMIVITLLTFISNYFGNPITPLATVTSTIAVFFVPGWVLIRVLGINNKIGYKKGVIFVLSLVVSACISSVLFAISLFSHGLISPLTLSGIYLAISVIPFFLRLYSRKSESYRYASQPNPSRYRVSEILLLIWLLIFFSFTISMLYPDQARVPGIDIVRHFSEANGLLSASDIYSSLYPWYHFLLASVIALSESSIQIFQSVIACLGFIFILSFYIMARAYLADIDRRAPALATVFLSVFSGFGWRYFLEKMPDFSNINNHIQTLDLVFTTTYFDIGYGEGTWIWFWFRPVTIGLIIFFVLIYMLRDQGLSKSKYVSICSLLLVTLSQIHFSEFVIFIVLIFILILFIPRIKLRFKETSLSIFIALAVSIGLIYSYPIILDSEFITSQLGQRLSVQLIIALGILSTTSLALARYTKRPFGRLKSNFTHTKTTILTLVVLSVYLILLFHWFLSSETFVFSDVFGTAIRTITVLSNVTWYYWHICNCKYSYANS